MITGIFHRDGRPVEEFGAGDPAGASLRHSEPGFAFTFHGPGIPAMALEDSGGPSVASSFGITLGFHGRLFNRRELQGLLGDMVPPGVLAADLLLRLYLKRGEAVFERINGPFLIALFDRAKNRFLLVRDHLGVEPVYYARSGPSIRFSSSARAVASLSGQSPRISPAAVCRSLMFSYNPSPETVWEDVRALLPGHRLVDEGGATRLVEYWTPGGRSPATGSAARIAEELLDRLRTAVVRRAPADAAGVFLSGGLDSSAVLALLSGASSAPIHTFSYRCAGESFDESPFARRAAAFAKSNHHELQFDAAHIPLIGTLVPDMDQPFCDSGINITSALLASSARGKVACVMTGDGGDELFAGHPVYEACRAARTTDVFPRFSRAALSWTRWLSDTDRKEDLRIKLRRFAEGLAFPADMLAHRWRTHFTPEELRGLLTPEMARFATDDELFSSVRAPDSLPPGDAIQRSILLDYRTVVDFYLRRIDLCRPFGFDIRFPLLDPELVSFCSTIPTRFMRGNGGKAIFKTALSGILPPDLLKRRKLGHSVPLKNWLRADESVRQFFDQTLSPAAVKSRGFVRYEAVRRLMDEHAASRRNNVHSLWSLVVLELWMQRHADARPAETELPYVVAR